MVMMESFVTPNRNSNIAHHVLYQEFEISIKTVRDRFKDLATPSSEINDHINFIRSQCNLYSLTSPGVKDMLNDYIFNNETIRRFYVELLETFCVRIAMIDSKYNTIFELTDIFARAAVNAKAVSSVNKDALYPEDEYGTLSPILTTLHTTYAEVVETYLKNPWLVMIAMIIMMPSDITGDL